MSVKGKVPSCHVEAWEITLAREITRSFHEFPDWHDLEAELFRKLSLLKRKPKKDVKDWKAFLAKSLFNAAHDYIRKCNSNQELFKPFDIKTPEGTPMEETIPHPGDPKWTDLHLKMVIERLSPELRQLWGMLLEEGGNQAQVAVRLGKPRMTVKYWIDKLKTSLAKHVIDVQKK